MSYQLVLFLTSLFYITTNNKQGTAHVSPISSCCNKRIKCQRIRTSQLIITTHFQSTTSMVSNNRYNGLIIRDSFPTTHFRSIVQPWIAYITCISAIVTQHLGISESEGTKAGLENTYLNYTHSEKAWENVRCANQIQLMCLRCMQMKQRAGIFSPL